LMALVCTVVANTEQNSYKKRNGKPESCCQWITRISPLGCKHMFGIENTINSLQVTSLMWQMHCFTLLCNVIVPVLSMNVLCSTNFFTSNPDACLIYPMA
jgi:hypothetical protein